MGLGSNSQGSWYSRQRNVQNSEANSIMCDMCSVVEQKYCNDLFKKHGDVCNIRNRETPFFFNTAAAYNWPWILPTTETYHGPWLLNMGQQALGGSRVLYIWYTIRQFCWYSSWDVPSCMNERVKEALSKGLSNHGLKAKSSKKKGTKLVIARNTRTHK